MQNDTVIATQTIPAEGRQVPIPFELTYDPALIDQTQTYLVAARIRPCPSSPTARRRTAWK